MSSADQTKTRCASCASGARPTQGFRQGACGATALFGVFEGESIVTSSSPPSVSPPSATSAAAPPKSSPASFQPQTVRVILR